MCEFASGADAANRGISRLGFRARSFDDRFFDEVIG
jgi:hypothetical protein